MAGAGNAPLQVLYFSMSTLGCVRHCWTTRLLLSCRPLSSLLVSVDQVVGRISAHVDFELHVALMAVYPLHVDIVPI